MPNGTVGTGSTVIAKGAVGAQPKSSSILVSNNHASQSLFLERSRYATTVTSAAYGFKVAPGLAVRVELEPGESVYACGSGAGTDYSYL